MLLTPNATIFSACYSEWLVDIAQFIADAPTGLTVGIYGRWGSGKSSACQALVSELYKLSTSRKSYIEAGVFDAFLINKNPSLIDEYVNATIDKLRLMPEEADSRKNVSGLLGAVLKKFAPAANLTMAQLAQGQGLPADQAKMVGQLAQTGLDSAGEILKEKVNTGNERKRSKPTDMPFSRFVIIIDDLDRCNPSDAIHALATIGDALSGLDYKCDIIAVLACDQEILARHAAHMFGISLSEGLEGISKYIHAPFFLPTGKTRSHRAALETYIKTYPGIKPEIQAEMLGAAESCIGSIPMREVLAALPQAILWSQRALALMKNTSLKDYCKIYYVIALLAVNLPGLIRQTRRESTLMAALNSLSSSQQPTADYGKPLLELLHSRPDICNVGRELLSNVTASNLALAYPIAVGYEPTSK